MKQGKDKGKSDMAKPVNTMNRAEVHAAVADHFGVATEEVARAFSNGQTEHLRSLLSVGVSGRIMEKQTLLTGAGITVIAAAILEPAMLGAVFGTVATLGLYGALKLSHRKMGQALHHALDVMEHGRPRQG